MSSKSAECQAEGCASPAGKRFPYCAVHVHRCKPCQFGDCEAQVAAYNRSGYCGEHLWYAQKLKRNKA